MIDRFYRGGEVLMSAMSGLDIALWDLKGKRLGESSSSFCFYVLSECNRCFGYFATWGVCA